MPIEIIDAKDAPAPPKKKSASKAQVFIDMLENLETDKVARITPDEDQTTRGIRVSIGRVASNRKMDVTSWTDEDEGVVYVKRNS